MTLVAKESGGGDFEMAQEGVYTARCYRILDLGTQKGSEAFGGKEQHKVMISWELIGDRDPKMKDGRPFSIHKRYTVSLSEKATLRNDLEAWRGKKFTRDELDGFDLSKVLGSYCTIQVVHSEDGKFANVNAIMAFRGEKPEPVNGDMLFDIDEPDMAVFDQLSDSIKGTIMQAPEWNKKPVAPSPDATKKDFTIEDTEEEVDLSSIPF